MLYEWIGDAAFRKGMKQYLTKFSYKNAFTEDLWESLSEASGLPVGDVMAGWTGRLGFPLVSAKVKFWDDNSLIVTLSQRVAKFATMQIILAELPAQVFRQSFQLSSAKVFQKFPQNLSRKKSA